MKVTVVSANGNKTNPIPLIYNPLFLNFLTTKDKSENIMRWNVKDKLDEMHSYSDIDKGLFYKNISKEKDVITDSLISLEDSNNLEKTYFLADLIFSNGTMEDVDKRLTELNNVEANVLIEDLQAKNETKRKIAPNKDRPQLKPGSGDDETKQKEKLKHASPSPYTPSPK